MLKGSDKKLVLPSAKQIEWADCEIGVIIHCDIEIFQPDWQFVINGRVMSPPDLSIFNPKELDTDQWIRVARDAGAKYAVLTAKHVTGFTLFPDEEYDYSIKDTPYKHGEGDIVADFVGSCRKYGLKPGLYYSCEANARLGIHKASGNLPTYPSKEWEEFKEIVTRHLSIIWSRYGELFEIWFDGGLLENGPDYMGLLQKYQPGAICFQGPHRWKSKIRWVGNERGLAPYPCWSTTSLQEHNFDGTEETSELGTGDPDGDVWMPPETDVPVRYMNWFWRPGMDALVAPPGLMMRWYCNSVGRNSNLLLGIVIDDRGLVPSADVEALKEFGAMVRERFSNPVGETSGEASELEMHLEHETIVNHVILMENISKGHRVREFLIEGRGEGEDWATFIEGSAIGHKFLGDFDARKVVQVRFRATKVVGVPSIKHFSLHDLEPTESDE
ncbi:MAG: alpha-L-fucosidase [Promethearchaeota archaeon]